MFQEIFYPDEHRWLPLPDWTHFLLHLGKILRDREARPGRRLVVSLVLPSRGYAAAFVATGVVAAGVRRLNVEQHFRSLSSLPAGTPVRVFQDEATWFPGLLEGTTLCRGEPGLVLRTGRTHDQFVRPKSKSLSVLHDPRGQRALPYRLEGRRLSQHESFIRTVLPGVDPVRYFQESARECVLIGQVTQLEAELVDSLFAVRTAQVGLITGCLQHFVRADRWCGGSETARSLVVPVSQASTQSGPTDCRFAIFDGTRAFLQSRQRWNHADWIVLLDKSAPDFLDGVYQLNENYQRWAGDDPDLGLTPPPGIELMVHEEGR